MTENPHADTRGAAHIGAPAGGIAPALGTAAAVAAAIFLAFVGSGAAGGTPIQEAAGGWLDSDSTPLAPGTGAFRIWSVIYAGLAGYAVLQLLPLSRGSAFHARLRPWAAASALLNGVWIWVVQAGLLWLSLIVIVVLLAVLCRILMLLGERRGAARSELVLVDGTFGLYLGWVSVATVANAAGWLGSLGVGATGTPAPGSGRQDWADWVEPAGIAVLAVAVVVGLAVAAYGRGRIGPSLALAWGLAWIAAGRLGDGPASPPIAWAAAVAAGAVALGTALLRWRRERTVKRLRATGEAGGRPPASSGPRETGDA
ncbi:TspO/MBR family protein [Zafaria sp. Z1313]|uniref:TspO/MBR family protein n=1 Tax=unclassified Zafaria TaxID=2828765 RepID=UPI002E787A0F|nr:TspO/MBR family protein [Zafaria sp. J156]MEE1620947.1 TspO/MBR family protein [Zafaria sp. J156]